MERDVVNATEDLASFTAISTVIREWQGMNRDPDIQRYLGGPLRRWIINDYSALGTPLNLTREYARLQKASPGSPYFQAVKALPDWAKTKIAAGQPVYAILAEQLTQQVRMLVDYMASLPPDQRRGAFHVDPPEMFERALAWHEELGRRTSRTETAKPNLPTLMELPDGYRWVELTPEACAAEGDEMQNCIADSDYAEAIREETARLFSLRDGEDRPHVTIETNYHYTYPGKGAKLTIRQIKGKQNQPPVEKYRPAVKAFLDQYADDYTFEAESDIAEMGFLQTPEGLLDVGSLRGQPVRLQILRDTPFGLTIEMSVRKGPDGNPLTWDKAADYVYRHLRNLDRHDDSLTPDVMWREIKIENGEPTWTGYVDFTGLGFRVRPGDKPLRGWHRVVINFV